MASDTCQRLVGPWLNGAIPLEESLAAAQGCDKPATVTLRAGCIHEHVKTKRYCAEHGQVIPADGAWFCLECAEVGHDCLISPRVVTGDG